MADLRAVCVFCGSSDPADRRYLNAARALGALVARRGLCLVYGGGRVGLMGELADAEQALAVLAAAPAHPETWITAEER